MNGDRSMEEYFRDVEWNFVNMNSPADLFCHYRGDGTICLEEYDRCRNGHPLLSSFFVDLDGCGFETEVRAFSDGFGIGLYFGDGCFNRYILAAVGDGTLEVRVPNGVPLGDTFRYDGPKRYVVAAAVPWCEEAPFRMGFSFSEGLMTVSCNGRPVLEKLEIPVPWKTRFARVMVMAVNDSGHAPKSSAVFDTFRVWGIENGKRMEGICVDEQEKPQSGVYLHVAGIAGHGALTDEEGRFDLGCLPDGTYEIIAGKEEKGFGHFSVFHDGKPFTWCPDLNWQQDDREQISQGELKNDRFLCSLNGVWKFSMDSEGKGEREAWYQKGRHVFEQRIRIPASWQSLRAFGEEFLADSDSLHQASTFRCNWREWGDTAWMQRTFTVGQTVEAELVIGAVSGIATLWLDGREVGSMTDFYSQGRFELGRLEMGREYTVTVRVRYPFEGKRCCFGKQGFWFTDSPGIWQNVWLEEKREVQIRDILVTGYQKEREGIRFWGKAELEFTPERVAEARLLPQKRGQEVLICWGEEERISDRETKAKKDAHGGAVEERALRIDFLYRAPEGTAGALVMCGKSEIHVEFDATFEEAYDRLTLYIRHEDELKNVILKVNTGAVEILKCLVGEVKPGCRTEFLVKDETATSDSTSFTAAKPEFTAAGMLESSFQLFLPEAREWSPESPHQYELKADLFREGKCLGRYERLAAFRSLGQTTAGDGTVYMAVNEEPVFIRGVLDQGYNPWGLYTYPSLEGEGPGSISFDVKAAGRCGYNLIRMHIKDNEPEWYSACDREGVLVWDEIPSCFYGMWNDALWRGLHLRRMKAMARKHNYHPSVILCSVFNESWGILGDHERSPWEEREAQEWIRDSARTYKRLAPGVLVLDNSGYGKTGETDILDYHSYPTEFADAFDFFHRLEKQNYPGSVFNCYHEENRNLMQDEEVADLLQRNCRNPLKITAFEGEDRQKGQPVLISEFVHTNEIERLVRTCRFAGYVRMNLTSQENEDTSPFNSLRQKRDFGYLHRDLSPAGYSQVNQADFIYLARPWLTGVQEGELITIPVYAGIRRKERAGGDFRVFWTLHGIDLCGEWKMDLDGGEVKMEVPCLVNGKPGEIRVRMPGGIKGAWLFAWVLDGASVVCEHDVQFEVFSGAEGAPGVVCWNPARPVETEFSGFTGAVEEGGRRVWWASGSGRASWSVHVPALKRGKKRIMRLEMSSCECPEGTRLTDEKQYPAAVRIFVQGRLCGQAVLPDQPFDRRALFSNGSAAGEEGVSYSRTGKFGYGYRVEVEVPDMENEDLIVTVETDGGGCVIYGNRMGRYGCDPMFLEGEYK